VQRRNLWAPWRMPYIKALSNEGGCFLCANAANPAADQENFVLWRTTRSMVVLNMFPYNNGHVLIAPLRHVADLDALDEQEMLDVMRLIRDAQAVLSEAVHPNGFNVGMNFGRCAGAGLPGHMHIHIVPRWDGDTNFMAVTAGTDVISQSMKELYDELQKTSARLGFPRYK